MTHYINDPSMVRVDFFKQSGKWYDTVSIEWLDYASNDIHETFKRSLLEAGYGNRFVGMNAVCLEPYHQFAHPVMIINW